MRAVIADLPKHWLEERRRSGAHRFDEMWDGVLHIPPARTTSQQALKCDLAIYLHAHWAKPRGCRVNQEVNLTTPEDEAQWTLNYRIPDLVLLDSARFGIDKDEYMVGAPLVVVEICSPGDETYDKFPFYAGLGVPEVWVVHRDIRVPEVHVLGPGPAYRPQPAGPDGWTRSPATGVEFRPTGTGRLGVRIGGDSGSAEELPDT
jgi:Uma2 family endonuclease